MFDKLSYFEVALLIPYIHKMGVGYAMHVWEKIVQIEHIAKVM